MKKVTIILIASLLVISAGGVGAYKYNKVLTYNKLMISAKKNMDLGNYSKSIGLYNEALKYKDDNTVVNDIKVAKNLKNVQDVYNQGLKMMTSKKYLEAINKFKKVTKINKKLYSKAQNKIKQCKDKYIDENIQLANNAYKDSKYNDANNYLENVLKIDSNNSEAKKIKDEIVQAQQQQNKTNVASNSTANVGNTKTNNSQPNGKDDAFNKQWISDQLQWAQQHNQGNTQNTPQTQNNNSSGNTGTQSDYAKQSMLSTLKQEEQEAQQELDNAQNQTVKIYENGRFVWAQDQNKIDAARNKLSQIQAQINALK